MKWAYLGLVGCLTLSNALAQEEVKMGKLFMTQSQRDMVYQQRQAYLQAQGIISGSIVKPKTHSVRKKVKLPHYIQVSGMMRSDTGQVLVRINAQYLQMNQIMLGIKLLGVVAQKNEAIIAVGGKKVRIPVGFTYVTKTRKLVRTAELKEGMQLGNLTYQQEKKAAPAQHKAPVSMSGTLKQISQLIPK